jgi:hypothetical protein
MTNYSNILVYIVRCNETLGPLDMTGATSDLGIFETLEQAEKYLDEYLASEYGPDYSTSTFEDLEVIDNEDGSYEIYATKHDGGELKLWIEDRIMHEYC